MRAVLTETERVERRRQYQREYYARTRNRRCELARKYYAERPEEKREKSREWYEDNRDRKRETNRESQRKRRALAREVSIDECMSDREVFERDEWMCRLCGEATEGKYPDPLSPSIDHIVPIARGGDHASSNLQTAHLVCNKKKGAREA